MNHVRDVGSIRSVRISVQERRHFKLIRRKGEVRKRSRIAEDEGVSI